MAESRVRRSRFAGSWYPEEPGELGEVVGRLLAEAPEPPIDGDLVALISPHAGLVYSGPVAAAGFRILERTSGAAFDSVVLLGPSHRVFFDALGVYSDGGFATPLGLVAIDSELALALERETPRARDMPEVHGREHCLEMQLPFLQRVLPEARILPIMMGNQSAENVDSAARALARMVLGSERSVLLLASSDLSHYETRERARELDFEVLRCIDRFDPEALAALLESEEGHACGGGPMVAVMRAARELGATRSRVLSYADSGDVTGETEAVVGYVSAAFFRARDGH